MMQSKDDPRLIAEAKNHPNGWVYVIDEQFRDKDDVHPENIMGAWRVDSKGKVVGDFIPNPNYKADTNDKKDL